MDIFIPSTAAQTAAAAIVDGGCMMNRYSRGGRGGEGWICFLVFFLPRREDRLTETCQRHESSRVFSYDEQLIGGDGKSMEYEVEKVEWRDYAHVPFEPFQDD